MPAARRSDLISPRNWMLVPLRRSSRPSMTTLWSISAANNSQTNVILHSAAASANWKSMCSNYVIGQDHAKKVLSVAVHNHYKRLNHQTKHNNVELAKSNILLIGPSHTDEAEFVLEDFNIDCPSHLVSRPGPRSCRSTPPFSRTCARPPRARSPCSRRARSAC